MGHFKRPATVQIAVTLSLRPYSVIFSSERSSFSFSEDPMGVEQPSLKGSLPRLLCSVLGCSVSVFLFKVDGKPEAPEHDYSPLLQKRSRRRHTSIRNFRAALPLLECRQVSY